MKGAKRYVTPEIFADKREDAVSHLPRRLVRERDRENASGTDVFLPHQICDAVSNNPSLAGAWTCEDKKRPVDLLDGLALTGVQGFENGTFSGCAHDGNDTSVRVRGGRKRRRSESRQRGEGGRRRKG